jgi:glycosyltransferase involved in cell wall biosynthesis
MAWWAIERTKTPRDSSNAPAGGLPLTGWPLVVSRRVDFALGGGWLSRRKYLHPACRYLAISMAVRDVLVRGGVAPERIHVVPSGIDPAKFTYRTNRDETRRALGIASTDLFVCNVAALVDHKDHATLVHAAKIALEAEPRLRFFVLGEGELRRPIEALIADFGIGERFRLLGFQEQVEPFVAAADLFVLSSHLEGLCTSLLDAMLLGVPIVATSAGGIPDVVVDGETGLLVEPRRSDALAAAIVRLAREPELRRRFAEAGARRVRERFLIEQTIALTERAYREILAGFHDQSCP